MRKTKAKIVLKKSDGFDDVVDHILVECTPSDYLLVIRALETCSLSNNVDKENAKKLAKRLKRFLDDDE